MKRRSILPVFRLGGPSLRRLRATTVLLVVSFASLMIAATAYHLKEQYDNAVENAARTARSTANTVAAQAARTFAETYRVLEGLGDIYLHSIEHGGIDHQAMHEMMRDKLARTSNAYVFAIFDAELQGVASGLSYPIALERYQDVPLDRMTDIGSGHLLGPLHQNLAAPAAFAEDWSIPLGFTVQDGSGATIGYILAFINTRYFASQYQNIDVGARGVIGLWTADRRLIAGTPNITHETNELFVPAQDEPVLERVTVHTAVSGVPLSASVALDGRDYLADWRAARNQIVAAVLGIILAMTLFSAIILRQLVLTQRNETALMQAKAAAEDANEAKSRFLAHMSHEFRTPLNAIMGLSEIIRNKVLGDSVSDAYTTYADHIHRSGEHLLNIVNDILDMAKIESGVQPLQQDAVDIAAAVSAAVSFVQGLATQRGLRIDVDVPVGLPCVSGDERFIRQVLINLLSNAIKFSPPEADILVRAAYHDGESLDVAVKDSGPGIEPAILRRLGEPFLQGNPAISHLGKGTGLGLSICKRYMDLLDGDLKIESAVGAGTTATIRFPHKLLVFGGSHFVPLH